MTNRNGRKVMLLAAIIIGLLTVMAPGAVAQNDKTRVIKPDSLVYGRTYSEWSAAWEQWADSIPASQHPLFDNGDCSVGQSGPVWFLGGKFCALDSPGCGYNNVQRVCQVPGGKGLYVAVFNSEYSTLEVPSMMQIADLRAAAAGAIDGLTDVRFDIDGASVPDLKTKFRVQSPAFGFTLPDDNLFTAIGEGTFLSGQYFPGVDDGVYVMVPPLSPGQHQLHFHGYLPQWDFTLDVTYQINVTN